MYFSRLNIVMADIKYVDHVRIELETQVFSKLNLLTVFYPKFIYLILSIRTIIANLDTYRFLD